MLHEDQEDFLRDFDILASQSFADFHQIIKQSVELSGNELASFFVCDRNWRKKKEITLINMQDDAISQQEEEYEDERRGPKPGRIPIAEMDKVRIKDIIDDPHQRLLYEYDFLNPKTFYIELMRILDADKTAEYPVCVKSTGKFISAVVPIPPLEADGEDEIALLSEFDDVLDNEDDDLPEPTFGQDIDFN
ncbi:hypothetical protein [Lentimicrobium sp.]|jgi:hypothetical protein|nr:hypothetical protein [Lentimicrobium sp.]